MSCKTLSQIEIEWNNLWGTSLYSMKPSPHTRWGIEIYGVTHFHPSSLNSSYCRIWFCKTQIKEIWVRGVLCFMEAPIQCWQMFKLARWALRSLKSKTTKLSMKKTKILFLSERTQSSQPLFPVQSQRLKEVFLLSPQKDIVWQPPCRYQSASPHLRKKATKSTKPINLRCGRKKR